MRLLTPFINDSGRLRSGWRLVAFILAFLAALIALDWIVLRVDWRRYAHGDQLLDLTRRILFLATSLCAGYLCARGLEGLPWRSLGLTLRTHWLRDLLLGSLIGFLSLCLAVVIATAAGGLSFSLSGREMLWPMVRAVGGTVVLFLIAALAEEALFRGYPLQTLSRAHLAWLGVFLTSVPFALAHLWNPNIVRGVTFANTALAGIWLAMAYLRTRSLWFPLGVHWSWNWALGSVFGLPVSGLTLISHPLIQGKDHGPVWVTGGNYGIEGGIAGTVALVVSTIFVWRTRLISADPELLKLTSEENPTGAHAAASTENSV
ncbi:MAG TPA: type II CAAX endopeptidase family protein [Pyrinomonadaceae bacterium]|nr:type II CAAX endopeptidase family protein [Pyrinomonadaceae bacterium]